MSSSAREFHRPGAVWNRRARLTRMSISRPSCLQHRLGRPALDTFRGRKISGKMKAHAPWVGFRRPRRRAAAHDQRSGRHGEFQTTAAPTPLVPPVYERGRRLGELQIQRPHGVISRNAILPALELEDEPQIEPGSPGKLPVRPARDDCTGRPSAPRRKGFAGVRVSLAGLPRPSTPFDGKRDPKWVLFPSIFGRWPDSLKQRRNGFAVAPVGV